MRPDPLPPSLRDLEARLARRPAPEPGADFRARVLGAVADERDRPVPARRRWRLAWQAAAAIILAMNLAMSAANGIRFQPLTASAAPGVARRAAPPRAPDALDENGRFERFAASALASLTPAPDAGALGRNCFRH